MRSRQFRKRIEVWQTSEVADGFGGYTVSDTFFGYTWANIKSINSNRDLTLFGVNNTQLAVEVTVRKRSDITYDGVSQYIKYGGKKYMIVSFPEDVNFDGSIIKFIAVKENG